MSFPSRIISSAKEKIIRPGINGQIRRMAKAVAKAAPSPDPEKLILSFNASTRITGVSLNAAFAMLTGWSLRLQGFQVRDFVCQRGMPQCVLGTNNNDVYALPPCRRCIKQTETVYDYSNPLWLKSKNYPELAKEMQGLDLPSLTVFQYEDMPLGELCLPSIRWILRRHHLENDEATRTLYRYYILSAFKVARRFDTIVEKAEPAAVVVFNGMQFPEAAARWVARRKNVPVYSHEVGMRPFSAFFTEGDATAYPVDIPADFQLTSAQDARLDEYLSNRFKGNFSMAGVQFWPEMSGLDEAFVAKMSQFKQVVPVFTNVIFDTSQPHANVIFEDMFTWLDDVLKVAEMHPATLFVIRAHPDESRPGKASRESVAAWAERNAVAQLPNVVFISPDEYFSSYEMIQRAKFVMIYNSTIGMEASIMGAPVLCAGKARFTQLDTVFFPPSREAYLKKLEAFLNAEKVEAPKIHRINARRFLYYQLYRTSLPFDRFIELDKIWPGYVRLKKFSVQDLLPENSPTMQVISDGILKGAPFILPEN